ncbi:MFS multidrug transporter-like protein [Penicillium macrosclerotiorum]|uniref:MFS multidrug transporter-like protein n=1 Tax=Penicillium macrosclerotiorum TaxID=303699 RepID=UPI002546D973|nr:MFS multidrug transporter-like protein [Penicillium macrosclerotiorum]KAJ5698622.1 MFS multidrug transporter-like protein [Penicillium macrosclerotiorum]
MADSEASRANPGLAGKTEPKAPIAPQLDSTVEDASPQSVPETYRRSSLQNVIIMGTLCSAVFLAALDITIVSTALPTISDYFQSTSGFTWIGSAFLLSAAVVAPSWGKFSDIWGRKVILLIAVATFFFGSALCGAAVSISMLIVGRAIQGIGGGGLLSLVSIVVGDLFSQRDRGKYYGIVGMVWAVAFTLGPLVGGAFTKQVSWRWCFYVNLPISGTAFAIILFMLKLETPKTPLVAGIKAIDWTGTLALVGGTLMLLLGLQFGGTVHPWNSVTVICLIVFGAITLAIFLVVERYLARNPIVPLHIYSSVSNFAVFVVNLFHGIILTCNTYFLPLYCQSVLGAEPLLSGVWMLPFAVSMSAATVGAGMYIKKTGRFLDCIRVGFTILLLGVGLLYDLPRSRTWSKIIIYQIISGFGVGLNFQPPMIALQSSVPAQDNAAATASFGLVRNVASAIGVVLGSVAFANKMNAREDSLVDALGPTKADLFSGSNAQANVLLIDTLPMSQQKVVRDAFWLSVRDIWILAMSFAAAAFLVCFLIRHKTLEKKHVEVKMGLAGEEERRKILLAQRAGKKQGGSESSSA